MGVRPPQKPHHLKERRQVPIRPDGVDQVPEEMHLHPQRLRLLYEEPVPVLPHPQVELRLAPEPPEELQEVHLSPPRLSAGDEIEKAWLHKHLSQNEEQDKSGEHSREGDASGCWLLCYH